MKNLKSGVLPLLVTLCMVTVTCRAQNDTIVNFGTETRVTVQGARNRLAGLVRMPDMKEGERTAAVVIIHGFNHSKDWELYEDLADSLAAHGIGSIRFDFEGHGQSEGLFRDMTAPREIEDTKIVVDYMRSLPWVDGIALVGHSLGGVVAAMTAGEMTSDTISAVVLLAPAGTIRDDVIRGRISDKKFDPLDPPETIVLRNGRELGREYFVTAFSLPIYETASRYDGPACIIHGTGDRLVPYTYGLHFHRHWEGSEYYELPGVDHMYTGNIERVTGLVSDFLVRTLK